MKYEIIYYKLGELPTMTPYIVDSFDSAIFHLTKEMMNMAPPYEQGVYNYDDPWDKIMSEMMEEKSAQKNKDFIKYCLPNGIVIEATAIDG